MSQIRILTVFVDGIACDPHNTVIEFDDDSGIVDHVTVSSHVQFDNGCQILLTVSLAIAVELEDFQKIRTGLTIFANGQQAHQI